MIRFLLGTVTNNIVVVTQSEVKEVKGDPDWRKERIAGCNRGP